MMWMVLWRPSVVLIGLVGAAIALITSVISLNPPVSNLLMFAVLAMMAFQGVIAVGLVVYGVWRPFWRWLQER